VALRKQLTYHHLLNQFVSSEYTLWVYSRDKLIFQSSKEGLVPLLDYIHNFVPHTKGVVVFDRVVGNAAALLLKEALCTEVYSFLGSELAIQSLDGFGIKYYFSKVVTRILNNLGNDICPMEKLSLGKSPEEFYKAVRRY
jgi:hypothetical protein